MASTASTRRHDTGPRATNSRCSAELAIARTKSVTVPELQCRLTWLLGKLDDFGAKREQTLISKQKPSDSLLTFRHASRRLLNGLISKWERHCPPVILCSHHPVAQSYIRTCLCSVPPAQNGSSCLLSSEYVPATSQHTSTVWDKPIQRATGRMLPRPSLFCICLLACMSRTSPCGSIVVAEWF